MFASTFLRGVGRGGRLEWAWLAQRRRFSGADTVSALRPLYFAVHPDFFGQHPKEREVNENSLKRLNGYLENLQNPGLKSPRPTTLTFYVRSTDQRSGMNDAHTTTGFHPVTFTLQSTDVPNAVRDVLKFCRLSAEHLQKSATPSPPQLRITWDKTYYTATGLRDPEQELQQARRVEAGLSLWLRNNEPEASRKQKASDTHREELRRLKRELVQTLSLEDIRWQRRWGVAHRRGQLRSLSRLSTHTPHAARSLSGRLIVFTDQSGLSASGHVMLGTSDVHHQWAELACGLAGYERLMRHARLLTERVCLLLGGVQLRPAPGLRLEEHYSALHALHQRLPRPHTAPPSSLRGLTVTLDNYRSSPCLHQSGLFIIPTTCDALQLQVFLQSHAHQARQRTAHTHRLRAEEGEVLALCRDALSLRSLTKEGSVSSAQMILCCRRLLEERSPQAQGLHLHVSHFYSLMQDGELCIPWDWRS